MEDIYLVTRKKDNARYTSIKEFDVSDTVDDTVLMDEKIELKNNDGKIFYLRRIAFWFDEHQKVYEFITYNYCLDADKIAEVYKSRWQIETKLKRLKQNFPLKYFLRDNQNAIEIQIWVSLIIQLITLVIQRKAEKKWAYYNMISVICYHLMTYIDLFKFLKNPKAK